VKQIETNENGISSSRAENVTPEDVAGRCWLTPGCPRVDRAWLQRLTVTCDGALSIFAFKINLRHYDMERDARDADLVYDEVLDCFSR